MVLYIPIFYAFRQQTRIQKVLHRMVASITTIQSLLNFWMKFFFITVVPKYLNWHISNRSVCSLYPDFDLHSGDEIAIHTYFSLRLFLDKPPY
jgi:hypothetical protein